MSSFKDKYVKRNETEGDVQVRGLVLEENLKEEEINFEIPPYEIEEAEILEEQLEEYTVEKFFDEIEQATTKEELEEIIAKYEELTQEWSEKSALLRSEKNIKKYLALTAALAMLQRMMESQELVFGKKLVENVQAGIKPVVQNLNEQVQKITQPVNKTPQERKPIILPENIVRKIVEIAKVIVQQEVPKIEQHVQKVNIIKPEKPIQQEIKPVVKQEIKTVQKDDVKLQQTKSEAIKEKTLEAVKQIKERIIEVRSNPNPQKINVINEVSAKPKMEKITAKESSAKSIIELSRLAPCNCKLQNPKADIVSQTSVGR